MSKFIKVIKKRYAEEFANEYIKVIDAMRISNNLKVVGTFSEKGLLYPADVDMFDTVKTNKTEKTAIKYYKKEFQNVIKKLLRLKGVVIADIKAGENEDKSAIRWRPYDVLHGHKRKFQLEKAFTQPARIKIDAIAFISNIFVEFSMIFFFENNGKLMNNAPVPNIPEEIVYLKEKGKYFKAGKRMYILKKLKKLVELFNSDAGMMYQISGHLKTIEYLLENERVLKTEKFYDLDSEIDSEMDEMITRLSMLRDNAFKEHSNKVITLLRKSQQTTKHKTLLKYIKELIEILDSITNAEAKRYVVK